MDTDCYLKEICNIFEDYQTDSSISHPANEDRIEEEEGEEEEEWLRDAGFGNLFELDSDSLPDLMSTLTRRQADTVKRKLLLQAKKSRKVPDVREVFPTRPPSDDIEREDSPGNKDTNDEETTDDIKRFGSEVKMPSIFTAHRKDYSVDTATVTSPDIDTGIKCLSCVNLNDPSPFQIFDSCWPGSDDETFGVDTESSLGITRPEDIGPEDLRHIKSLSLIELTSLYELRSIIHKKKRPTRRKNKDGKVFGVSLQFLLDQDRLINPELKIPLVFKLMIDCLKKNGLKTEGLLRIAGASNKLEQLQSLIELNRSQPDQIYELLSSQNSHDVASLLKRFIRNLSELLLTNSYTDAFLQVSKLSDEQEQIHALNLLTLMLPDVNRNTCHTLLEFIKLLSENSEYNKMTIKNLATILAPNLFPPIHNKMDLNQQVELAQSSSQVVVLMIKYQDACWKVPYILLKQVRLRFEVENKRLYKQKIKFNKHSEKYRVVPRKDDPLESGLLKVYTPTSIVPQVLVLMDTETTSKDVVYQALRSIQTSTDFVQRRRAMSEIASNRRVCMFSGNDSSYVKYHFLYEIDGNIGRRRLDHHVLITSVLSENPLAELHILCHH